MSNLLAVQDINDPFQIVTAPEQPVLLKRNTDEGAKCHQYRIDGRDGLIYNDSGQNFNSLDITSLILFQKIEKEVTLGEYPYKDFWQLVFVTELAPNVYELGELLITQPVVKEKFEKFQKSLVMSAVGSLVQKYSFGIELTTKKKQTSSQTYCTADFNLTGEEHSDDFIQFLRTGIGAGFKDMIRQF